MSNALKLLHGHTRDIPCAPPNAHQGNIEQVDTIGLPLPSGNTPFDHLGPVSGAQVTQISQPTISITRKRKIEEYSRLDSISTHNAHKSILSDDT